MSPWNLNLTNKKQRFYTAKSCSTGKREGTRLRSRDLKSIKGLLCVLLLTLFCLAPMGALAVEKGETAPDFKLPSMTGEDVSLSEFKGRMVLLKLATTWCPTCKVLSAEIKKIGDFLKEQDVVVLEVFVQDSKQTIKKYLGKHNPPMTFHALLDDGQAYEAYNVYLIPRFLLIDEEQVVRFDSSGQIVKADDIRSMVLEYSRSPAIEVPSAEPVEK
jgi:peroxiredoxin